jgi:putative proteasome-type protease
MYAAARAVGDAVRRVSDLDRAALERDDYNFNIHLLLGGQVKGGSTGLYCIYPQGNPLSATQDSPYLQIGEAKYGRPILDRGIVYDKTPLDVAALYAMLSFDATIRSNVTVGPPLEMLVYRDGSLDFTEYRRFAADDSELLELHARWETALRRAVEDLPRLHYTDRPAPMQQLLMETVARP